MERDSAQKDSKAVQEQEKEEEKFVLTEENAIDFFFDYQKGLAESELKKIMEAKPEMKVTVLTEEQRACFKEAAAVVEAKFEVSLSTEQVLYLNLWF